MAHASTIMSSTATRPAYSSDTFRQASRNRPVSALRILALWQIVTFWRPFRTAYSNA